MFGNLKVTIILKHIGLFIFGTMFIGALSVIIKKCDQSLNIYDWITAPMSFGWSTYSYCNCYLEYNRNKKNS